MGLEDFEQHLKIRLPGFQCVAPESLFVIKVRHKVGRRATRASLKTLRKLLGKSASKCIMEFYGRHDGASLYCQAKSNAAALRFFPIGKWESMTKRLITPSHGEDLDDWGNRLRTSSWTPGIVIGEIPHSSNYFVIRTQGRFAGHIFYYDHENSDTTKKPLAKSFEALLDMIWSDPITFIQARGNFTRYSDGKSIIQWIPKRFMSEVPRAFLAWCA